jgi:hypothetical protein
MVFRGVRRRGRGGNFNSQRNTGKRKYLTNNLAISEESRMMALNAVMIDQEVREWKGKTEDM